jgi:SAM-dependent methyltransferase
MSLLKTAVGVPLIAREYAKAKEKGLAFARIPEPAVMTDSIGVKSYDEGGKKNMLPTYRVFARMLHSLLPRDVTVGHAPYRIADFGSGPANHLILLAQAFPGFSFLGSELSRSMVERANENIGRAAKAGAVGVQHTDCTMPFALPYFDASISLYLAHHLPDQAVATRLLQTMDAMAKRSITVVNPMLLVDFARPPTPKITDMVVKFVGSGIPSHDEDFRNSLNAAFSPAEWAEIITISGIRGLRLTVMAPPLEFLVAVYRSSSKAAGVALPIEYLPSYPQGIGPFSRFNLKLQQQALENGFAKAGFPGF